MRPPGRRLDTPPTNTEQAHGLGLHLHLDEVAPLGKADAATSRMTWSAGMTSSRVSGSSKAAK